MLSVRERTLANQTEPANSDVAAACRDLARRGSGDTVQDACVRALQVPAPETISDPVRYVLRIARNLFIDRRRKGKREAQLFEHSIDVALAADDRPGPERVLAGKESLAGILAAIEKLPPRCREAFVLHRFENLSYPLIAHRMAISISAVEKHVAEAMVRLKRAREEMS
jgi:RNA polymerase sigma factor (sigma-70 family)